MAGASMISAGTRASEANLAARFQAALPFRHLVADGFLEPAFAEQLLSSFPPFEDKRALNEAGEVGRKAVVERIRSLGGAYRQLDALASSAEFLALVSRLTGIPGLLYDPHYFGGGTHENRNGQELDAHVDFNRHPLEGWHRRLNLIVYLNHDWQEEWGGALELHSNPMSDDDQVVAIAPLFNRCVLFETTGSSWHGFSRISLPPGREDISRKSIALYFYTRAAPAGDLGQTHSTIYVDRPLPERMVAGRVLDEQDVNELQNLLARRDQHNQRLYRDLTRLQGRLDQASNALLGGALGRLRYLASRLLRAIRRG
jgi:hypothetical protein